MLSWQAKDKAGTALRAMAATSPLGDFYEPSLALRPQARQTCVETQPQLAAAVARGPISLRSRESLFNSDSSDGQEEAEWARGVGGCDGNSDSDVNQKNGRQLTSREERLFDTSDSDDGSGSESYVDARERPETLGNDKVERILGQLGKLPVCKISFV
eukprot:SAG11_NODE_11050_length_787_cov_0.748547_2_plen_158_part_00